MTDCTYYKTYNGPNLVNCILDNINVTELVTSKYGENNNWGGKLWTYKDLFGNNCLNKNFHCSFISNDQNNNREHWFKGCIDDINDIFNAPLIIPITQDDISMEYIII